ncbi:MAG TPA: dihydroorotase [Candidatus Limnocylindrales bacterium]|nr:dihydroorotase [Candidatus Limnocylindrales bacterium]
MITARRPPAAGVRPALLGKTLIRGGRVVDPATGRDGKLDLLIEDGRISAIGAPGSLDPAQLMMPGVAPALPIIDATGLIVAPGFLDMHVHLREPGFEYKETIETGTRAAVAGGVTSVACMANTDPVNDNAAVTKYIQERGLIAGYANVYPIGAVSLGLKGERMAEFGEMVEAGIVAVSDDGMPIDDSALMRRALEYARMFDLPVIAHEEDSGLCCGAVMNEGAVSVRLGLRGMPSAGESVMVARDIELVRATGGKLHIAHISCAEAVEMVRRAKADGLPVTAEAAPHHFILDESAVLGYNTNAKMKPPLRGRRDVEAVREGLADGTIDAIATDHAPHHRDEKVCEFDKAAFGIVGLETMMPLALALVRDGYLTLSRAIEAMSAAPARILSVDRGTLAVGAAADVTIFDPNREWRLSADQMMTKSRNTPFDGWTMTGKVVRTIVGGATVWQETAHAPLRKGA